MAQLLKSGDTSIGACLPPISPFVNTLGSQTLVYVGPTGSQVLVLGDMCNVVDCDPGPGVSPCIPTLNQSSCSPNVFAGLNFLPVGISEGVMTCEYVSQSNVPAKVIVN